MQESTLQDKINAIGSDTIMGAMNNYHMQTSELPVENTNNEEHVESSAEAKTETANAAIDKLSAAAMQRMIHAHPKPMTKDNKIGRNDPCPCGKTINGKPVKYKNCCLNSGKYETYSRN